jgi:DNA-binding XRE family transcriptional regulator
MYGNLEAEMVRCNIDRGNIAKFLNVRYATIVQKLNGTYPFKLTEAMLIKKEFFPNLSIEYLFQADEKPKVKMRN